MKKAAPVIILIVLMIVGLGIFIYPFVSNLFMNMNSDSELQTYLNTSKQTSDEKNNEMLRKAREYNSRLVGNVEIGDPFAENTESDDDYYSLLSLDTTDVMAVLEIPSIEIQYPVYHGTGDSVLKKGIGHLKNTSLPVGGKGTHSVLVGHTGYAGSKLFSDLDKLEKGDMFYIFTCGEKLAYRIDRIDVVLPEDLSLLKIDSEEDYVTLVTCTPFGQNTHRLLVRGTRVSYNEKEKQEQTMRLKKSTWDEQYIYAGIIGFSVMAGILIVFFIFKIIFNIRRKRKHDE